MPRPESNDNSGLKAGNEIRAAIYLRVSTGRQAEKELSIPDQRRQIRDWCAARGLEIIEEFIEPGASATDDRRPEFQRMMECACSGRNAFGVIVVHSFSRLFRNAFGLEFYIRKLAKQGIRTISITQELGDDPAQAMVRQVIALFDEYQSKENAKHVIRAMKENTRQGFWNGAPPPLGYRVVAADRRGTAIKKKLAIDPIEAELVRLIFRLFLDGDGKSGPMGVKTLSSWLNAKGYRTRGGGRFGGGTIYSMLTNPTYTGRLRFNVRDGRTRKRKAESEHVSCAVPAIIAPAVFERVQAALKAKNPREAPVRGILGPVLLSGLAVCAGCGGSMVLRTGTSRSGKIHRYYTCSTKARAGKTACKGRSFPMQALDDLVMGHIMERLLIPGRLDELFFSYLERQEKKSYSLDGRLAALEQEAAQAEEKLRRLYRLVEDGAAAPDETLKEQLRALRSRQEKARAALQGAKAGRAHIYRVSPAMIQRFRETVRRCFTEGKTAYKKRYLSAILHKLEIDDHEIRISGRTAYAEGYRSLTACPRVPVEQQNSMG